MFSVTETFSPCCIVARTLRKLSLRLLLSAATSVLAGFSAEAQSTAPAPSPVAASVFVLDIPAQPLASALAAFGRQTGLQVAFPSEVSRGVLSSAVVGRYSGADGLARLLAGTGLSGRVSANRSAIVTAAAPAGDGVAADGALVLDTVTVTADDSYGFLGTPDWVYQAPRGVSVISRKAIQAAAARDTRDLFSGVSGVYVSSDNSQSPGTNVNIRGLQDQTRVTTMIDGARQNFQRSAHGSTGMTYIDPAFIRAVEVEKTSTSGVGGAASLGGSVNFRTLKASDLIASGRSWGAEMDGTTGTNAFDFATSGSAAVRITDAFALIAGLSSKRVGQYEPGTHGGNVDGTTTNTDKLGSETQSGFFKAEIRPSDDTTLDLSWMRYRTEFRQNSGAIDVNTVTNDTLTAAFGWNPDGDLIDLKTKLWYNRTRDDEFRPDRGVSDLGDTNVRYQLQTFGGSVENTSRFDLALADLSLNYGVEAFRDDGDSKATSDDIDDNSWLAWWYQGANPSGVRDVASGFANAKIERDWLSVDAGVRYDWYRLTGSTLVLGNPVTTPIYKCLRYYSDGTCRTWGLSGASTTTQDAYDTDVDLSAGAVSPTLGVTVKPTEGVQLFAKYAHSFRPPTISEAVMGGAHPGSTNAGFYAPNPNIEPEEADTFELGANFKFDNILLERDTFRAKATVFKRWVDNYIALGTVDLGGADQTGYSAYVNLDGKTPMRGVELEANYDARRFYVGGSFTYLDADYASTYTYNGASYLTSSYLLFVPPKMRFALDAGLRFFDETVTIGGRVTRVGAADEQIAGAASGALVSSWQVGDYTLFDLYGSFKFNDTTTLRFAVNNLTDEYNVPSMGQYGDPAPGRTATVSLNLKF